MLPSLALTKNIPPNPLIAKDQWFTPVRDLFRCK